MAPPGRAFSGTVTDPGTGQALAAGFVYAIGPSGTGFAVTVGPGDGPGTVDSCDLAFG